MTSGWQPDAALVPAGMLVLVGVLGHSQLTQRLAVALANHLHLVPPKR